jgi:hypothetical protein
MGQKLDDQKGTHNWKLLGEQGDGLDAVLGLISQGFGGANSRIVVAAALLAT